MDPADFVRDLFARLDREVQTGYQEVSDWIEAQVHGAAVQLLDALVPPIVHTNNTALKISESAIVGSASAGVWFTLNTADLSNTVLAGAVADTVRRGVGELQSQSDYGKGVNSLAW